TTAACRASADRARRCSCVGFLGVRRAVERKHGQATVQMPLAAADRNDLGRELEPEAPIRRGGIEAPAREHGESLLGLDAGERVPVEELGAPLAARELLQQQLV